MDIGRDLGIIIFDPGEFAQAIFDPLFHLYCQFIEIADGSCRLFSKRCELCLCHRDLFKGFSVYQWKLGIQKHFGEGVTTCPMAGMIIPEIINGEVDAVHESILSANEGYLLMAKAPSTCRTSGPE